MKGQGQRAGTGSYGTGFEKIHFSMHTIQDQFAPLMLEVELKTLHLTEPFRIAHGSSSTRQVLRVHENGCVGEAPFVPYYDENPATAMAWLRGEIRMETAAPRVASLALDLCRRSQTLLPLWHAAQDRLGPGRAWQNIHACRSLGIPTDLADFEGRVRAVAAQFRVLKLKLGSGNTAHDEAIVATARKVAPEHTLLADVNGGWALEQTLAMLPRLQPYGLALLEQPLHHHRPHSEWAQISATARAAGIPLYADESTQNADDVRALADHVDGVNVKLLKCGSFSSALEMISTARQHRLGVILGCMIESSLGTTAAAHLAPWADFVDLDGHLYLADDDYTGISFDVKGRLILPAGAGIAARPKTSSSIPPFAC